MPNLTPNFTLEELVASDTAARLGIDNTPTSQVLAELKHTAALLEQIRTLLGGLPVRVSSGYRCLALNRALRSADSSAHVLGQAADFVVPGFGSPLAVCRALAQHQATLQFDQLIHEFGSWVHIGRRTQSPRGDLLTINSSGTYSGLF